MYTESYKCLIIFIPPVGSTIPQLLESTSPERIPYYPQPAMPPLMTQSCMNHYGLTGFAPPPAAALGCPSTRPCRYPYGFSPTPGAVPGFAKTPGAMNPLRYDQD